MHGMALLHAPLRAGEMAFACVMNVHDICRVTGAMFEHSNDWSLVEGQAIFRVDEALGSGVKQSENIQSKFECSYRRT